MAVRLTEKQIGWLADQLLADLTKEGYIAQADLDAKTRQVMIDVVAKNLAAEATLERDARDLLAKHLAGQPDMDSMDQHKAFTMVKRQLAKDRGFVL